ncbi:MAG: tetratricopeptide repeat protein [Deferrisomatales bacterium]
MTGRYRTAPLLALLVALAAGLWGCPPRLTEAEQRVRDGNDYFEAGQPEKAASAYTRALELGAAEPGVRVNRGNARALLGDEEGALADYAAALAAAPGFAQAYANRAILRDRRGEVEPAIQDYRRALELDPSLGAPPGILTRILYNPPTQTLRDRLEYLEANRGGPPGR